MHLFGLCMFEQQEKIAVSRNELAGRRQAGKRLCAVAAILLAWMAGSSCGYAQQAPGAGEKAPEKAASELPSAPSVVLTQPVNMRPSLRDFSKPAGRFLGNPINIYRPTSIGKASFSNSVRLTDLVKDGKIYLSLSDALALALENNYDIAIARYDLDIADTDLLRTRTGAQPLGAPSGLITGTLGGSPTILTTGGGPGGTTVGSGGAGSGTAGLTLTTAGAGPTPESLEPSVMGAIQFDRAHSPSTNFISGGTSTTNTYNAVYNQGFVTGTQLQFGFNNSYAATSNGVTLYSPQLSSNFKATVTQHLLQGAGIWVNKRWMYQALNDRRITDSSFRQQILYTVNRWNRSTGAWCRPMRTCRPSSTRWSRAARWQPTTASSWRSAPWRRWTCSTPISPWLPTSNPLSARSLPSTISSRSSSRPSPATSTILRWWPRLSFPPIA